MKPDSAMTRPPVDWSVNDISIGDTYDKVIQRKGEASLNTDIQGMPVLRYYYEGERLLLLVSFGTEFLLDENHRDDYEPSVIHVEGIELTGPGGFSLSAQDSTQRITEFLGEPDKIRGRPEEDYYLTYFKGKFLIDIHLREDKALTFHLKKIAPPNDCPGAWMRLGSAL